MSVTNWDKYKSVPEVEALVGSLKIISPPFFLLPSFFPPRPAPLGRVPDATAWGTDSGHRDGPGGQDPHRHLLSEQCAFVSTSLPVPPFFSSSWGAALGCRVGVKVEREMAHGLPCAVVFLLPMFS